MRTRSKPKVIFVFSFPPYAYLTRSTLKRYKEWFDLQNDFCDNVLKKQKIQYTFKNVRIEEFLYEHET